MYCAIRPRAWEKVQAKAMKVFALAGPECRDEDLATAIGDELADSAPRCIWRLKWQAAKPQALALMSTA